MERASDPRDAARDDQEPALERLRVLAVVLPLAYVAAIAFFLAINPFPSWASAFVALVVSAPLVVAFTAVVFNVVHRTREEILEREQRIQGLVESAPDGIISVDGQGKIRLVNQQALRMFGYAREELLGEDVEQLVPAELREAHVAQRREYERAPRLRPMGAGMELWGRRKDGSTIPVEISLSPTGQTGGLLVTAVIRDISVRRALEDERQRLLAETETQRERGRIAMDLHDGIIQSIYATSLALEQTMEELAPADTQARARLDRAIGDLDRVIRDIRSYIFGLSPARTEAGLAQSLDALAQEFRVNSLIELRLEVAPDLPPLGKDATAAMFHVAQEALHNARKHARATSAALTVTRCGDALRLEVADNGVGFDPAAEVSASHNGLRNMMARATSAGGTLAVESAPGGGTRVRFELPLAVVGDTH